MTGLTTDRSDPRLGYGVDDEPVDQHEVYLVLDEEERAKGFVRPYCENYKHVGAPGPRFELSDLTSEQEEQYGKYHYVKYEKYPKDMNALGRYWTQTDLDRTGKGCGVVTHMGVVLSETYAREPRFYGATYCVGCSKHLKVGADGEFLWCESGGQVLQYEGKDWRVGT